jgi:S-formylglutathione hydrolase
MYSYIVKELPVLVADNFPCLDPSRTSIMGHSMGGHGALTIAIKNQQLFRSVSAFSPISNPSDCPWGTKAFTSSSIVLFLGRLSIYPLVS